MRTETIRRGLEVAGVAALAVAAGRTAQLRRRRRGLEVAEHVDLERYLGTWHEIARLPTWFERTCVGSTATYAMRTDGRIQVINRCRRGSCQGQPTTARGTARVVDTKTNARLKVSFMGPLAGDYWILDVDPEYRWALVGAPNRRNLWILAREPALDDRTYWRLVEKAAGMGFPVEKLERPQSCAVH
jgi:apolipoprotein D and lipocalin family protein